MKYTKPKVVHGKKLEEYFLKHVTPDAKNPDFFIVKKELRVFKKAWTYGYCYAIVNLIIPVGEKIYAPPSAFHADSQYVDTRKMRASKAEVRSIWEINLHKKEAWRAPYARSDHCRSFVYKSGHTVVPAYRFSMDRAVCDRGIHFFLNLADALDYSF